MGMTKREKKEQEKHRLRAAHEKKKLEEELRPTESKQSMTDLENINKINTLGSLPVCTHLGEEGGFLSLDLG